MTNRLILKQRQVLKENIIKCHEEYLESLNEMLLQSQKEDRELIDFVQKKEVLSEMEKQTYTDDFKSQVTKDIIIEIEKTTEEICKLK